MVIVEGMPEDERLDGSVLSQARVLATHCSLLTTYFSLPHNLRLTTHHSLLTTRYSLLMTSTVLSQFAAQYLGGLQKHPRRDNAHWTISTEASLRASA